MSKALRALLSRILDYAGMFPPASLSLTNALSNYRTHAQSGESWMLGRFICPALKLGEVELPRGDESPLDVSVLGRGGESIQAVVESLQRDLIDIESFRQRHCDAVRTEAYEVRIPEASNAFFSEMAAQINKVGPPKLTPYFELANPNIQSLKSAIMVMAQHNAEWGVDGRCQPAGLKLRCGGVEAKAFPSAECVASVIAACRDAGVALKFTAGLHQPSRRFNAALQTHMHGFLNVFFAGILGAARNLDEVQMRQILEDDDATNFDFDDNGLYWNDLRANVEEIVLTRQTRVISFGSCSFDEPCDGLRAQGLIRST